MEDRQPKKSERKAFWVGLGVVLAVFCLVMATIGLIWGGEEKPTKSEQKKPSQSTAEESAQQEKKSQPAEEKTPVEEPAEEASSAETYEVQAGDTLFQIGLDHNVDWTRIAEVNQLEEGALLKPGQKLIIPPK
jgi:nucleoid-associated protein YgaU